MRNKSSESGCSAPVYIHEGRNEDRSQTHVKRNSTEAVRPQKANMMMPSVCPNLVVMNLAERSARQVSVGPVAIRHDVVLWRWWR